MPQIRRTPPRSGGDAESSELMSEAGGAIPKNKEKKYSSICKEPKFGTTYKIPEIEETETEEDICGVCDKKVRDNQNGIGCDTCDSWYHCGCVKMHIDEYKLIQKLGKRLTWNCGHCGTSLREQNEKLKEENKKLVDILRNFERKIDTKLEEFKHELRNNISKSVKEEVIEELKEEEEKKQRQKNLVFYKMKESRKENNIDREIEDKENCADLVKRSLKIEGCEIEKTIRPGKRYDNERNHRPLLVVMKERNMKYEILTNASKLKNVPNENHREVYITPDLTLKQREENKKLREELKRRRENGENVYIRGGRLVEAGTNFRN